MQLITASVLALAAAASAKTIVIDVGKSGAERKFSPETFEAEKGDILEFHFWKGRFSVVQGDIKNNVKDTCLFLEGGFYSGPIETTGDGPNVSKFVYKCKYAKANMVIPVQSLPNCCQRPEKPFYLQRRYW